MFHEMLHRQRYNKRVSFDRNTHPGTTNTSPHSEYNKTKASTDMMKLTPQWMQVPSSTDVHQLTHAAVRMASLRIHPGALLPT